jgi:integrase/recombinase XerD
MQALRAAPDRAQWTGRRAEAWRLPLSNRGARVSEGTAWQRPQGGLGASPVVQLLGKGRRERTVPLWPETAQVLQAWGAARGEDAGPLAFPTARGKALSREGVDSL